jgi:hypothetical protein
MGIRKYTSDFLLDQLARVIVDEVLPHFGPSKESNSFSGEDSASAIIELLQEIGAIELKEVHDG